MRGLVSMACTIFGTTVASSPMTAASVVQYLIKGTPVYAMLPQQVVGRLGRVDVTSTSLDKDEACARSERGFAPRRRALYEPSYFVEESSRIYAGTGAAARKGG